jgi:hypothetical protein
MPTAPATVSSRRANASVSSVKQFVIRIDKMNRQAYPLFVERVSEAFVVRGYHAIGCRKTPRLTARTGFNRP